MQCFITRWNTEKRVENMTRSGVFFMNFEVFHPWWNTTSHAWYYFSNKMILVGVMKDAKMSSFHLISKHSLNINSFVMVREKKRDPYRHPRLYNNPLFQILVKKNNLAADNEIRDSRKRQLFTEIREHCFLVFLSSFENVPSKSSFL